MPILKIPDLEERILSEWKEKDIFAKTLAKPAPQGNFVFFEGPPTANGMPHMGHVETRAFKDVILRFKTMQGYHVERKAGWDTQGLPVELEIEKQLGLSGKKDIEAYGLAKFNAKARESVWKYKELWEKMTERVGFWLDFDHPYITYSNEYIETLWWIFKQAWDLGLLVQDYKVLPYCPRCGTALSTHEVAQGYQTVTEPAITVKFALVDEPGTYVLAWTTTPWTLPGNVALAVGQDIRYVKTAPNEKGERYILAVDRAKDVLGIEVGDQAEIFPGADLVGKKYHPLFSFINLEKESKKKAYSIAAADFVTTLEGTGVVHTAVMYGVDDFQLGKTLGLPAVHTVDETGRFTKLVEPWAGLEVRDEAGETQKKIIAYLAEHHALVNEEAYTHDYPFCWRCKHALLYYAKTSWFIAMTKVQAELQANNEKIAWVPGHIKDGRFGEWLRDVKDWAISRERYWGTPLPIWQCDADGCGHQECLGGYRDLLDRVPAKNRYLFIRHGESTSNTTETLNTMPDKKDLVELTPKGRTQATAVGKALKDQHVAGVYSSQFKRARDTAALIGQEIGVDVVEDARLNEFRIGPDYEGKPYDVFHQKYPHGAWAMRFHQAPPGGETWLDIRARMFTLLHELDAKHEGKTFVIITHGAPIFVVKWAADLRAETQTNDLEYPGHGATVDIKLPLQLFQPDGSFDPHRPYIDGATYPCPICMKGAMHRVPEVADTWFDSGSMPFAQWHYPFENQARIDKGESYPANYITEAIDQTRGWFYTLLAVATVLQKAKVVKQPPYENVVVLGHVRDAAGKKLSKSLGNYFDPMTLITEVGADPVRLYLMTMNQPGEPKNFDPAGVNEITKKFFFILMNVASFWEMYAADGQQKPSTHVLDRWIMNLLNQLVADVTTRLESYDLTGAGRALMAFVTDLSTWYVRRSRDRFKTSTTPDSSSERKGDGAAGAATLQHVLQTLAVVMAPFTPFVAEALYTQAKGKEESVHLAEWPKAGKVDDHLLKDMTLVREIVETGHALRAAKGLKVRQPLMQVVTTVEVRPELDDILREELNVRELHTAKELPTGNEWATQGNVALDCTVTDELKEEGMVRDVIREVNALRKEARLTPRDQIILHCAPHTTIAALIERYQQMILSGVRAKAATPEMGGATHRGELHLGGERNEFGISRG